MTLKLHFDSARPQPGHLEQLSPLVRRWVLPNPSAFTCTGTCCYVVGKGRVAVIDPGPGHLGESEALLAALEREQVTQIIVTHTHRDHSPGARVLAGLTGALIAGCGQHVAARALNMGERSVLDASADRDHAPDLTLRDGDVISGEGFTLEAIETPGHTMNHLAFACREDMALFSGDHVMAWSTTIVAPPDGAMGAYMASLEKLRGRSETVYWPGHGGPVKDPQRYLRAIIGHRKMRESSILAAVVERPLSIPALVERLYEGLNPALKGAAALSVFAHLEDLAVRGRVIADGELTLEAVYVAA
jgi:glyoxylase-like metal-dependent hydrolase (beta-lactamase superfamily II)